MDFKELIERLRHTSCSGCMAHTMKEAATAIETLLTEREAAVEELRGICWCCAHGKKWDKAPALSKMTTCEYMPIQVSGALARGGGKCKCPHWEWRGPQKEEATP